MGNIGMNGDDHYGRLFRPDCFQNYPINDHAVRVILGRFARLLTAKKRPP